MFENTLAVDTKKLLDKMSKLHWVDKYYLAGGTALALQLGHRQSVDLDFFCIDNINNVDLKNKLSKVGKFKLVNEEENTIDGILDGVKVSFMTYPYPLLYKAIIYKKYVKLAFVKDIAVMKLGAIAGRNTKKDFIDLYYFLHKEKLYLNDLFKILKKKFKGFEYDKYHIYKSLIFFNEADKDPTPKMIEKIEWDKVKRFFKNEIKNI